MKVLPQSLRLPAARHGDSLILAGHCPHRGSGEEFSAQDILRGSTVQHGERKSSQLVGSWLTKPGPGLFRTRLDLPWEQKVVTDPFELVKSWVVSLEDQNLWEKHTITCAKGEDHRKFEAIVVLQEPRRPIHICSCLASST